MTKGRSLCVTGHRDVPDESIRHIKKELRREVLQAVEDGFTHFLTGMANGVDLYFAEIVADVKRKNPEITMEAAIPLRNRLESRNPLFRRLIKKCDSVMVQSEEYVASVFMDRNRYMVDNAERVIAVYDGRNSGGTYGTINYARKMGRDIRIINAAQEVEWTLFGKKRKNNLQ